MLLATVPAEPSLLDLGGLILSAFSGGQYALLGAAVLLGLVLLARRVGTQAVPWLGTPRGGATLSLLTGGLTVLVARLSTGAVFGLGLVLEAVAAALTASGLWSVSKNLATPKPPVAESRGVCTPIEIANGTCKP